MSDEKTLDIVQEEISSIKDRLTVLEQNAMTKEQVIITATNLILTESQKVKEEDIIRMLKTLELAKNDRTRY